MRRAAPNSGPLLQSLRRQEGEQGKQRYLPLPGQRSLQSVWISGWSFIL